MVFGIRDPCYSRMSGSEINTSIHFSILEIFLGLLLLLLLSTLDRIWGCCFAKSGLSLYTGSSQTFLLHFRGGCIDLGLGRCASYSFARALILNGSAVWNFNIGECSPLESESIVPRIFCIIGSLDTARSSSVVGWKAFYLDTRLRTW